MLWPDYLLGVTLALLQSSALEFDQVTRMDLFPGALCLFYLMYFSRWYLI